MSDDARYQVGDTCYTGVQAAANALLAKLQPYTTMYDFQTGSGPEMAIVTPYGWVEGECWPWHCAPDGTLLYNVTSQYGAEGQIGVAFYPVPCELDALSAARISDMVDAWGLFFLAAIVIFCVAQVRRLFDSGPHLD